MNFISAFEVIGPNMVGPSSSHTAGAVSIGKMARKLSKYCGCKLYSNYGGAFGLRGSRYRTVENGCT